MNILVGQYHLNTIGGTETFTYTLVKELHKQGHTVDLYTMHRGYVSTKIESEIPNLVTNEFKTNNHDISLLNHNVVVDFIRNTINSVRVIQTCHGIIPQLEKPSVNADYHVSISKEVGEFIRNSGFKKETTILNGIDCERFTIKRPISNKIRRILSLCQSESANNILLEVSNILGCELVTLNKNINPKFDIEEVINSVDLVVGLGRSAYDSMSCGRPVFIWDDRNYQGNLGDGYLRPDNFDEIVKNNCSGRRYKKSYDAASISKEILENYDKNTSQYYRDLALSEFNISKQVKKYLDI